MGVQTFRLMVLSLLTRCLSIQDEMIQETSLGLLPMVWMGVKVRALFRKSKAL